MPKPHKGESQSDYISRAVKEIMAEGKTQDQALGQAYGMWRQAHGGKKRTAKLFLEVLKAQPSVGGVHERTALGNLAPGYMQGDPFSPGEEEFDTNADFDPEYPPIPDSDLEDEDRDEDESTEEEFEEDEPEIIGDEYELRMPVKIVKAYPEHQIIVGWASVVKKNGEYVVDKQGDVIPVHELENAVLDYAIKRGAHGLMHEEYSGGRLVLGLPTSPDFMKAAGLTQDEDIVGFLGVWHIPDREIWEKHKRGELPELSISGRAKSIEVSEDEVRTMKRQEARGTRLARERFRYP